MKIRRSGFAVLLIVLSVNGKFALASGPQDREMNDLAGSSGCNLCHNLESKIPGAQQILPYGPGWKDIARRYKGDTNAVDKLTRVVRQGSGPDPVRHWKNKTSVTEMLPNAAEISETDARKLVAWILSLDN